jgi:hypothetical protein
MLKNVVRFEHTIGPKIYHFICDPDSPLPEAKEALFQFLIDIGKIEEQIKATQTAAEAVKQSEKPADENKTEVS